MKKYSFKHYNKNYPKLYKREKLKLRKILLKAKIEHVGSTAVKGLGGKGIIDVLIGVNQREIKKTIEKLKKAGYIFKKKAGEKNRKFFEKDYDYKGKIRRVHLQLTPYNSKIWKRSIIFRDLLRQNKEIREEYTKLKKKAIKLGKEGKEGKEYREYKKKFFKRLR